MNLKEKVFNYLKQKPVIDNSPNKLADLRKKFNLNLKQASAYWVEFKKKNGEPILYVSDPSRSDGWNSVKPAKFTVTHSADDTINVTADVDFQVKTLEDLFAACEVDEKEWEVVAWQCKKWDLGIKNASNEIETKQLYSVSAKFKPKTVEDNLELQKEVILKELFKKSQVIPQYKVKRKPLTAGYLLELALFDVHFGKLAHYEEVGEDYDLKIAATRYLNAIDDLLSNIKLETISRILFPIGQDMINVDNLQSTTTAGTRQDCDSRFHKIIRVVKDVLISTINTLSKIAPVDVIVVPGNHDEQSSFMVGEIISAYYHNNENVVVVNSPAPRKYYKYGDVSFMFSHGNKEKFNELGTIFAAENPKLWGATTQRYIQIGHFHHTKLQVVQKQEFQGYQVQIMPSLSGSDAWHKGKGFQSLKQAKAFLFDKHEGLFAEFTHTAK